MSLVHGLLGCALVGSAYSAPGAAQDLGDPMRPARASPEAGDVLAAESRLRSVILSSERKLALIDGQLVALGGKVGDAVLVRIGVADVTLKRGEQYETLHMYPGVQRRARTAPEAGKKEGGGP